MRWGIEHNTQSRKKYIKSADDLLQQWRQIKMRKMEKWKCLYIVSHMCVLLYMLLKLNKMQKLADGIKCFSFTQCELITCQQAPLNFYKILCKIDWVNRKLHCETISIVHSKVISTVQYNDIKHILPCH